ncbi:MAG: hypothetical protein LBS03_07200 [Bacteroidales bacterium]|jgi:hypothetical protein|nr:hypothetical protein [Bacteroidales bacterium]
MKYQIFERPIAVMLVALMICIASCKKSNDDDGGIYTPPANLTSTEISTLLVEAVQASMNKNEITYTQTGLEAGYTMKDIEIISINRKEQKFLYTTYYGETLTFFTYIEGTKCYEYEIRENEKTVEEGGEKILEEMTEGPLQELQVVMAYVTSWKVEGNELTGAFVDNSITGTVSVTLTSDKLLKSGHLESVFRKNGHEQTDVYDAVVEYKANPAFPENFNKADFK